MEGKVLELLSMESRSKGRLMKTYKTFMEKDDPCWKGYEMIGMKKKNGKEVPNCVPKEEQDAVDEGGKKRDHKARSVKADFGVRG